VTATETDGIVIEGYEPGPVEVYGRRLKMEYVGMASVFVVIAVLIFGGSPWLRTITATAASFFLFLGLKKKNRDHLMCSMHLFGAAVLARPAVFEANWALPLLLFGATVFSAERYLEKKPQQVAFLPLILGAWAWLDGLWPLGLAYSAAYILCPRSDREGATRILVRSVIADSTPSGSMLKVSGSISTNTGMQLCCMMQVAELDHEYAVTITSSPAPQPHAARPMCSAAVPELVVTA